MFNSELEVFIKLEINAMSTISVIINVVDIYGETKEEVFYSLIFLYILYVFHKKQDSILPKSNTVPTMKHEIVIILRVCTFTCI